MAADRQGEDHQAGGWLGDVLVLAGVVLASLWGALGVLLPANEYEHLNSDGMADIVDCDIVAGMYLVPATVALVLLLCVLVVRLLRRVSVLQYISVALALTMLAAIAQKIPQWRREALRAKACVRAGP